MCSLARVDRKHANECTTGNMPRSAMPPAADTMCCSAMPHSMKRSGSASLNASMPQSDSKSASITTISGRVRAIASNSSP